MKHCIQCGNELRQKKNESAGKYREKKYCSNACRAAYYANKERTKALPQDIVKNGNRIKFSSKLDIEFATWHDFMRSMYMKNMNPEDFLVDKICIEAIEYRQSKHKLILGPEDSNPDGIQ
jgi:hypothetical protein